MNAIPDLWKMYRDSGCKCQVEDAAGYPTIVLHSSDCPIAEHVAEAATEEKEAAEFQKREAAERASLIGPPIRSVRTFRELDEMND